MKNAETETRDDETVCVIDALGELHGYFAVGQTFAEPTLLGEAPDQPGTGKHRGQPRHIEALALQVAFERSDIAPEEIDGPGIVAHGVIALSYEEMGPD